MLASMASLQVHHVLEGRVRIENAGDAGAQQLARIVGRDQRGERVAALEEDLRIRAGIVERQMTMRVDQAGHHGHALDVELLDATLMRRPLVGVGSNGGDLAVLDEDRGRVRIPAGAVDDRAVLDEQGGVHSGLLGFQRRFSARSRRRAFSASSGSGLCALSASGASQPTKFVPYTSRSRPTVEMKNSSERGLFRCVSNQKRR